MAAPLVLTAALIGFALVIVAVTWLNFGSPVDFSGLFPAEGRGDWPRGVQEGDVPHFAVDQVDAPRRARPADAASIKEASDAPPVMRIEPVVRHVHGVAMKH